MSAICAFTPRGFTDKHYAGCQGAIECAKHCGSIAHCQAARAACGLRYQLSKSLLLRLDNAHYEKISP